MWNINYSNTQSNSQRRTASTATEQPVVDSVQPAAAAATAANAATVAIITIIIVIILVFVIWDDNGQYRCCLMQGWWLWQQPSMTTGPHCCCPHPTQEHHCLSSPSILEECSHVAAVMVWQKNCPVNYICQHNLSAVVSIVPLHLHILLLSLILISLLNKKNRRMQCSQGWGTR